MTSTAKNDSVELRTLIVSAIGLSIAIWDIAFNLGAFGTVFYTKLQALWVASTVVLLCVILDKTRIHSVSFVGSLALFAPTIWFGLNALGRIVVVPWFHQLRWFIALAIFVTAVPYILLILFELADEEFFYLSNYHRKRLTAIVAAVAIVGYLVGTFHPYFVSCRQFEVAGNYVPENCAEWDTN